MQPRKLLHVFSTFGVGGPQARFAAVANHFGPRYKHSVVSMDGLVQCRELLHADVDCDLIAVPGTNGSVLQNAVRFRRLLSRLKPDLLLTYNWGAIEWAMANYRRICPQVHLEDGFGPEESRRQLRRRVLVRRFVLPRVARKVVVPSRSLYNVATRQWKLPEAMLQYVPNAIDTEPYRRPPDADTLARFSLSGQRPLIGTAGSLRPEKNLSRLIRSFRIVRESMPARLVILGDGPQREMLESLCRALQLTDDVVFTGYVREVNQLLTAFELYALSSDTEQMPLGVLEAMAAGLPIAGADVGDVKYMVSEANAPFIVERDDKALARSILALLKNAGERRRIGELNRQRVEQRFSPEVLLRAYDELYQTN
jgi:glycosyltransferase involved in cell wall biosynthesis